MGRVPFATERYNTGNKSPRQSPWLVPDHIVLHHAAGTSFDLLVALMNGGKQVSATLGIKDLRVASMFEEEPWRAWSLSSAQWDSRSLSVETCNESTNGWTISELSYLSLARAVAYWCQKFGIPCNRNRVIGHREVYTRFGASYATACPGGMDLDRVVREAQAIIGSNTSGGATPLPRIDRSQTVETVRRAATGDIFNITWEGIKHLNTSAQASISAAVQYQDDTWHNLTDPQFYELIDAYAIPRSQVYGLPGNTGLGLGHVWSATQEARAQNAAILAAVQALGE